MGLLNEKRCKCLHYIHPACNSIYYTPPPISFLYYISYPLYTLQKSVLIQQCSHKTGGPRSPFNPSFHLFIPHLILFLFPSFSRHGELRNLYRLLDVCYKCRFYSYFTFHLSIPREIER